MEPRGEPLPSSASITRLGVTTARGNSTHHLSGHYFTTIWPEFAPHPRPSPSMGIKRFKSIYPRHYSSSFPPLKIGQRWVEISMENGNYTVAEFTMLLETKGKVELRRGLRARDECSSAAPPPEATRSLYNHYIKVSAAPITAHQPPATHHARISYRSGWRAVTKGEARSGAARRGSSPPPPRYTSLLPPM